MLDKNQNSNLISRRYIDEFEEDLENDDYNVNSEFQKTPVNEVNNNLSKMDDSEPYIMTIQLDTKTDKIKLFNNSNPAELAFEFCKKNSLDFETLNYLTDEITKILKKNVLDNRCGNRIYNDCIEEVENEEDIKTESKLTENNLNHNQNLNDHYNTRDKNNNQISIRDNNKKHNQISPLETHLQQKNNLNNLNNSSRNFESINDKNNSQIGSLTANSQSKIFPNSSNDPDQIEIKSNNSIKMVSHKNSFIQDLSNRNTNNSSNYKNFSERLINEYPIRNIQNYDNNIQINSKNSHYIDHTNKSLYIKHNEVNNTRNQQLIKTNKSNNKSINKKSTIYDKLYDDAKLRKIIKRNPSSKSNCILQEIIREKQNNNKSGTNFGDNFYSKGNTFKDPINPNLSRIRNQREILNIEESSLKYKNNEEDIYYNVKLKIKKEQRKGFKIFSLSVRKN